MHAGPTGFAIVLVTTVVAVGVASAQSSYPCTDTNANLSNPVRSMPSPSIRTTTSGPLTVAKATTASPSLNLDPTARL